MQFSKVLLSALAVVGIVQAANDTSSATSKNGVAGPLLNEKSGAVGAAMVAGVVALLI
ncbi:hypothetical protein Kpol_543p74a [Vanderwaltozyma polyspora DSM 70294]|uniref:Uncharacterized protein n=1 Tax=Vanderwaltozyma polyspora (strain ATCC 22028 / DSM 70294 / BCRC 21397 / CBS 2163 / NBRC 10782 / NRRL Y-8283 / UCD 57-17) TaxID=436907 RepID=A7THS9_VANPO|nr:uncharacterized protein Kpol_543p74a [Vanderwaltozyma polyspora DSM 70294]EDO18245.1 hypothetical protein Kpol_543p74a [Vanderwaltozyma polyspora DSM 70294]